MNNKLGYVIALAVICCSAKTSFAAGSTSPGKSSVHASVDNVNLLLTSEVTGQIVKGKKKTVLEIDVTVVVNPVAGDNFLQTYATVNGLFPEPLDVQYSYCANTGSCTVHGHYWIDIDAAEVAAPGEFVGKPLDIVASAAALNPAVGDVSFRARVVKK